MDRRHLYADGLSQATLLEGLVRLDFFCAGERAADGSVSHEPVGRLILSPAAFLRAYEAMGQLVARMEEAGLVQRRDAKAPAASTLSDGKQPSSPNFA